MLLKELISGLDTVKVTGSLDTEITGIAYDSRNIVKGWLFVCKGFNFEEKYIHDAVARGAAAILAGIDNMQSGQLGIPVVTVDNPRYALAFVSDVFYGHITRKLRIIGITGTKGKTTTAYMIKSVFDEAGIKTGLIGTIKNMIGSRELHTERTTPESADLQELFKTMADEGVKAAVMEVSSHALDLHRVSCVDFDTAIFTNLTRDHMDYHGTFENYLEAKAKLFRMCGTGFVNIDSEYGCRIIEKSACRIFTFGIVEKHADIRAENIEHKPGSVGFTLESPWGSVRLDIPIPGVFTVYNALGAASVCLEHGIPAEKVRKGLGKAYVPGRAEITAVWNGATIMIDYAHTPDSLENIINTVKEFAAGRIICVFGCGGDRDRTKRPIMAEISGRLADFTVLTSDNPRTEDPEAIIDDVEKGIKGTGYAYTRITDRREAIKYSILNSRENDIIILAGKGHETYQQFRDKTIHFDEREVVREIIEGLENEKRRKQ